MPSPEVIDLTLSDDKIQPDPIRSNQGTSMPTRATNYFRTSSSTPPTSGINRTRRILPVIQSTFAAIERAEKYLPLQPFFNNTHFGQTLINCIHNQHRIGIPDEYFVETCINTYTQNGFVMKELVKIDEDSQTRDYTIIYIRFQGQTRPANKSAEQHQEPSEQDSFNHLLYKVLRLTSEQVQDLNDWMAHRGIPNVIEVIAQNFRKPHALEDNLKFITQGKTCYIQSNVMISLSLMISYIKHHQYSAKSKYFGPFYYIQIDPQDYDEWRTSPPEEEIHFQTPSKFGSPTTPQSTVSSEASES